MIDNCFLFIHYHYPPIKNSGVYRNYYLSTAISDKCTASYLITTDNRKILPNESLPLHSRMQRFEAITFDYRKVISLLKGKKNQSGAQFSEKTKASFFASWMIKIQRSIPFNIFLAEGSIFYIIHAYFIGKRLIRTKNINIIYSSFMPYSDHIVAWMLKKKFPSLIWVADFRDLHVEPIYKNVIWPNFQKKVEKFILGNADVVTTVSDGISQKMMALHQNVHTITKGVDIRTSKIGFDKFTIHYSGSLFQQYRDPKPLFNVLAGLIKEHKINKDKICFLYAGKDGSLMQQWAGTCGISDVFVNKGMLSRNEAIEIQDKAHINLLLTSASDEHAGLLTGKLFEYIEAGKEILCFIKGSRDKEIETMFTKFQLGIVLYDEDKIREYILKKYNEYIKTGEVKANHLQDAILQNMSWERQADRVFDLVSLNNMNK